MPSSGDPLLALAILLIVGTALYFFFRPKDDNPPLSGDDHSEPF